MTIIELDYADHSRIEWYPANPYTGRPAGDPVTRNSGGSPRPALLRPLDQFVVHYVGSGAFLDPGDSMQELAAIERWHAIPQKKPNEYNSASDGQGITYGYAGPFRAAHAFGYNTSAWGHLVLTGREDPTPVIDKIIAGILKMRRQLVAAGFLSPGHIVEPHRKIATTGTPCPGPLADNPGWWSQISAPLDQLEDDMGQLNYIRLRIRDRSGKLYNDQVMALTLGNREALGKLDADDDRLFTATIDGTRAEIEAELGFPLSPS